MSIFGKILGDSKKAKASVKLEEKLIIDESKNLLDKYINMRKSYETKVIEDEKWYKSRHWDLFENKNEKNKRNNEPEPTTPYLFNTITNKHADLLDNYPKPLFYPREQTDQEEANRLTKIVPVILQKNNFKRTYNKASWTKIKSGLAVYGVFWNNDIENGLGDIDIKKLNLLNTYWDFSVENIQDSRSVFIATLVDDDILQNLYPDKFKDKKEVKTIDIKHYEHEDNIDYKDKSVVIDRYYKKINEDGQKVVHLLKFVGDTILESTEYNIYRNGVQGVDMSQTGLYEHGKYPVVLDICFPEEDLSTGFGFVAIIKNLQMYIDKLDQIIIKNGYLAGKPRYVVSKNSNIKISDLADFSKDVIEAEGTITDEHIKELKTSSLDSFIINHRDRKIAELKETSGANEVSRGETSNSVTAASAIVALQEASNKISRDLVQETYNAYEQIIYLVVELIRQFYTEDRTFRITNEQNQTEFINYNNNNLQGHAIFDIEVKSEKQSPYERAEMNALGKELFGAGFFNPQLIDQALMALELMDFPGKENLKTKMQQLQTMQQQLMQQQQIINKMNAVLTQQTGQDVIASATAPKTVNGVQLDEQTANRLNELKGRV